jgi:hypothetical protein
MSIESGRWIRRVAARFDALNGGCCVLLYPEITVEGVR